MKHFNRLALWDKNAEILNIKVVVLITSTVLQTFDVHSLMTGTKSG
jgi:rRNA-processing protein FCF1